MATFLELGDSPATLAMETEDGRDALGGVRSPESGLGGANLRMLSLRPKNRFPEPPSSASSGIVKAVELTLCCWERELGDPDSGEAGVVPLLASAPGEASPQKTPGVTSSLVGLTLAGAEAGRSGLHIRVVGGLRSRTVAQESERSSKESASCSSSAVAAMSRDGEEWTGLGERRVAVEGVVVVLGEGDSRMRWGSAPWSPSGGDCESRTGLVGDSTGLSPPCAGLPLNC